MSVENNSCFHLLSRNKIEIYTVFVASPLTLFGPETGLQTEVKVHGLNVFENRALKRTF
jgi:hypothetical protein